jgi:hypothetical protein
MDNRLEIETKGRTEKISVRATDTGEVHVNADGDLACDGGTPPTTNVDEVQLSPKRNLALPTVLLEQLQPGATPELDGTNEVEVVFAGFSQAEVSVKGTNGDDSFVHAEGENKQELVDVAAIPSEEAEPDIVVVRGLFLTVYGRSGADQVSSTAKRSFGFGADGGSGPDTLLGGPGSEFFTGGPDDDEIRGGGKEDFVAGDSGLDIVTGGAKSDFVDVFDWGSEPESELADCGPGYDFFLKGREDQTSSCEERIRLEPVDPPRDSRGFFDRIR